MHVTGVELAQNGDVLIKTVTLTKRWWHRRTRYTARVFLGDYGRWMDSKGRQPSKKIWKLLDEARLRDLEKSAELHGGVIREVAQPSIRG